MSPVIDAAAVVPMMSVSAVKECPNESRTPVPVPPTPKPIGSSSLKHLPAQSKLGPFHTELHMLLTKL